jgi:hypothetical protein
MSKVRVSTHYTISEARCAASESSLSLAEKSEVYCTWCIMSVVLKVLVVVVVFFSFFLFWHKKGFA